MRNVWAKTLGMTAGIFILLLLGVCSAAYASTYYVNNQTGSNCSDAGAGTSTSQPWCSFTPVNNHGAYAAGDQILLARGATWNQQMNVSGTGTSGNWIILGAYGTGNRPIVSRNNGVDERGIKITNPDYWSINDLEVANAGAGIMVFFNTLNHNGLSFSNIYVHHNYGVRQSLDKNGAVNALSQAEHMWESAGIIITGALPKPYHDTDVAIRNIRMNNIEGTHNLDSVSFDFLGHGQYDKTAEGGDYHNIAQDIVLNHLYFHNDDNPMPTGGGCDEGLRLFAMQHAVVMNSILDNEAPCYSQTGTTAVILGRLQDVNIVNSMVKTVANTNSNDEVAFDYEYYLNNVRVRNTLMQNTQGAGLSFLQLADPNRVGDFLTNAEGSGNVLLDNNAGAFRVYSNKATTGTLSNNLTNDSTMYFLNGGNFNGWTLSNNLTITQSNIYSADLFSGTQGANNWSYQYNNGSGYVNLGYYDSVKKIWQLNSTTNTPQISQFEMHPDASTSHWVARSWTAPSAGVVSIRGRILKSDAGGGDGVIARITKNGTSIWGNQSIAYNDEYTGVDQVLDNVTVAVGDIIRFEINENANNSNDTTSWVPAIAYTSISSPGTSIDQNNSSGTFTNYNDIRSTNYRLQTFIITSTTLPKIDIWTYKNGSPAGDLVIKVYALDGSNNPTGTALFTTCLTPASVSATPGWITVNTNLTGLTSGGKYGFILASPSTADAGLTNAYGFGYSDANLYTQGVERYSSNNGSSWSTETNRSLKFIAYKNAAGGTVDQNNSSGIFTNYNDIRAANYRLQIFTITSTTLPKIDIWTYKNGSPSGDLVIQVYAFDGSNNPTGSALFTTNLTPVSVSSTPGWVTVNTNLTGLTSGGNYGFILSSPSTGDAGLTNAYGFGYSDANLYTQGVVRYSSNSGSSWSTEANRSLKFLTYK